MANLDEEKLEQALVAKGKTAPRITPDKIDAVIERAEFYVVPRTTCTVCALVLKSGFVVVGKSASASPENFDAEIGREVAFRDARQKIWELEGYLLRHQLGT